MKISRFEDVEGWQLARDLTQKIYAMTSKDKFSRDFGLKDQIQRAAGSVMHNVAEGFDSSSNSEFVRFLRYAQRSGTEVQSQLYIAKDQSYLEEAEFEEAYALTDRAKAKIGGLIKYLLANPRPSSASADKMRNQELRTGNQ